MKWVGPLGAVAKKAGQGRSTVRLLTQTDEKRSKMKLEALFTVPDRFWAGQRLCDPPVWPVFRSGAPNEFYGHFYDPCGDALSWQPRRHSIVYAYTQKSIVNDVRRSLKMTLSNNFAGVKPPCIICRKQFHAQ